MRTNAALTIPLPRILTGAFAPYAAFVLVMALLFGGGARQGLWSDILVQLPALPLLPWAVVRLTSLRLAGTARWALVLLCCIAALPLLQMIPLPPALWTLLPGRSGIATTYQVAGLSAPWLPVSLAPAQTWRALLSLLPAFAIFLATLSLDYAARRTLVFLVLGFAVISVPLDLLQMMGGVDSSLRFYAITNPGRAVGFFANANHHATLLFCAVPLACAWAIRSAHDQQPTRRFGAAMLLSILAAVAIGTALTLSRAGLGLGVLGGLLGLALMLRFNRGRATRRLLISAAGAMAVVLLVAFQFGFVGFVQRTEETGVMSDLRWPVARVTWRAASNFTPVGSGFGSFVPIYEMFAPPTLLREEYVNHAHDDWLELWLEGGVPAYLLALGFMVWFAIATFAVWRYDWADASARDVALARAASAVILLIILHSVVDYPLRTMTISTLFALCCGLLVPPARSDQIAAETADSRRHSQRRASGVAHAVRQ